MRWLPDGWRRPPGRHERQAGRPPWAGDLLTQTGVGAGVGVGLAVGFALLYANAGVPLPQQPPPLGPPPTIWQPPPRPGIEPATGPLPPGLSAGEPGRPPAAGEPATPTTGGRYELVGWSAGQVSPTGRNRLVGSLSQPQEVKPGPSPSAPLPAPSSPVLSPEPSGSAPATDAPSPPSTPTVSPPSTAPPSEGPVVEPPCRDDRERRDRPCRQCDDDDSRNPEHRRIPERPQPSPCRYVPDPNPETGPGTKLGAALAAAAQVCGGSPTPTPETPENDGEDADG
jgi:hypothetical protein